MVTLLDALVFEDAERILDRLGKQNRRFAGKTVLLSGAAGFLGMQFVHYFAQLNDFGLLNKPVRLIAMDNFQRGKPSWVTACRARNDIECNLPCLTWGMNLASSLG